MTVLEVIQRSAEFLARKGVESPRLQIELLLAHVLQMPRMKLYLNFERVLAEPELETLRGLVKRRAEREPLQHIIGSASFCGFEIAVNRDVLVPRPETELLAEQAWKFLQSLETGTVSTGIPSPRPSPLNGGGEGEAPQRPGAPDQPGAVGRRPIAVLDFGTGSGCLAIVIAAKCPQAIIHAVDVSEAALHVAKQNAARNHLTERIHFYAGDGFTALPAGLQFDLLVSNPPYIPSAEIPQLQPEVRDHDPVLALDGGMDGLDFYRRLTVESAARLKPDGRMMLELGDGQAGPVSGLLTQHGWLVDRVEQDYSGRERILIARHND